jgi:hypothetical protein
MKIMMNSIFKSDIIHKWYLPIKTSKIFKKLEVFINNDSIELLSTNTNFSIYGENNCHNNVNIFIKKNKTYDKLLGFYVLINKENTTLLCILHSVVINKKTKNVLDITPCRIYDKKLFVYGKNINIFKQILYSEYKIETINTTINTNGYFL